MNEALKDKMLKRLAAVEVTPKWMMLKDFVALYPLADQRTQIDLAKEVKDLCVEAGLVMYSEHSGILAYLQKNYDQDITLEQLCKIFFILYFVYFFVLRILRTLVQIKGA